MGEKEKEKSTCQRNSLIWHFDGGGEHIDSKSPIGIQFN